MPRFALDSADSPEFSSPSVMSASAPRKDKSSTRLSCARMDGSVLHTLKSENQAFVIKNHRLPLYQDAPEDSDIPSLVTTTLPDTMQQLLRIDPPLEIFTLPESLDSNDPKKTTTSQICLYSQNAVFLITADLLHDAPAIQVIEPFADFLVDHAYATRIIRVRPAPQQSSGHDIFSPGGLAMLVENTDLHQHTLLLFHAASQTCTEPLSFGTEQVLEQDRIVDFCFSQSAKLSLLSAMAILILRESGDVLGASPILFERSAVLHSHVQETLQYLQQYRDNTQSSEPFRRLCRAAQVYVVDTFGAKAKNKSSFATARHEKESAMWPVKIQGPILVERNDDDEPSPLAKSIESFGRVNLAGLALGREDNTVDFCLLSPTSLIPRFAFESYQDTYDIDDALASLGISVERLRLGTSNEVQHGISLVRDVLVDTMLHYVTPNVICTVQSEILRAKCRQLEGMSALPAKTTAWAVVTSPKESIQGCVCSGDLSTGHSLIITLTDGTTSALNVNETRFLNDMNTVGTTSSIAEGFLGSSEDAAHIDGEPFHKILAPTIEKIRDGLDSMVKLLGSQTKAVDVAPDQLAAVVKIRDKCDQNVVIPVLELKQLLQVEKKRLAEVLDGQKRQIDAIKSMISVAQDRTMKLAKKMEVLRCNNMTLSEKSISLHSECLHTLPKITLAEAEYFAFVDRMEARLLDVVRQSKLAEEQIKAISNVETKKDVSVIERTVKEHDAKIKDLMNRVAVNLEHAEHTLKTVEHRSKETLRSAGIEPVYIT